MPLEAPPQPPLEAAAPLAAQHGSAPERFQIPIVTPNPERCPPARPGEIVVCAADPESFRMRPIVPPGRDPAPPNQIRLGENSSVETGVEQATVGGWSSNRAMVRYKLKF
ncbi:MAG: hypothetical protein JSR96_09855 [Proteobacteria bacterium]|nr:hypothetical protein [Pseudomonadota bacterium]